MKQKKYQKSGRGVIVILFMVCLLSISLIAGALQAAPLKIKITHQFTEQDPRHVVMTKWLSEVNKATSNKVTGTIYANSVLGSGKAMIGQTKDGIVDVSAVSVSYAQGLLPEVGLFVISPVPANFKESVWCCMDSVYGRLDQQLQKKGLKLVGAFTSIGAYAFFFRTPINSLKDMTGKKVRTAGGPEDSAVFKELGMHPVNMAAADQYQALQTGVVDGVGTATSSYLQYKLYDVAPYGVWVPFKYPPYLILMNLNTWNKIDKESQKKITALYPVIRDFSRHVPGSKEEIEQTMKMTKGDYTPTQKETDEWTGEAMSVRKDWMQKVGPETTKYYFDAFGKCTGTNWYPKK